MKIIKTQILWWKTTKYCQKNTWKHKAFFMLSGPTALLCIPLRGNIALRGNAVCNFVNFFIAHCNFLTKFCSLDPSFNRNILTSLYLKSEHLRMRNYATTRLYMLHTKVSHGVSWKRTLRILLINGINRQRHECDHVTFLRNTLRCAPSY